MQLVACPSCKQKLAILDHFVEGTGIVCANCETVLRLVQRKPLKVEIKTFEQQRNQSSRPESFG